MSFVFPSHCFWILDGSGSLASVLKDYRLSFSSEAERGCVRGIWRFAWGREGRWDRTADDPVDRACGILYLLLFLRSGGGHEQHQEG